MTVRIAAALAAWLLPFLLAPLWPASPLWVAPSPAGLALVALLLFLLLRLARSPRIAMSLLVIVIAGYAAVLQVSEIRKALLSPVASTKGWQIGQICSPIRKHPRSIQFDFCGSGAIDADRIEVSCWRCEAEMDAHRMWRLLLRSTPARVHWNPGYHPESWQAVHEAHPRATVIRAEPLAAASEPVLNGWVRIRVAAQTLKNELHSDFRAVFEDRRSQATMAALVLGDGSQLEDSDWQLVRNSGLVHLLVVSGLHCSLVAAMLVGTTRLLRPQSRVGRWARLLLPLAGVWLFYWLAGPGTALMRAAVMFSVAWMLRASRLRSAWHQAWLLGAAAVLLLDPYAILSPGFWMSFLAVALLLTLSGAGSTTGSRLWQLVRVQVLLSLALIPASAYLFGEVPLISPLVNLLAIPLVSFILLPAGLLLLGLVVLLPSLAAYCSAWLDLPTAAFWWLAGQGQDWPRLSFPGFHVLWLIPVMAVIWAAYRYREVALQMWIPILILALLRSPGLRTETSPEMAMHVLDVGQGLAVLARHHGETLLYDTGPGYGSGAAARGPLVASLKALAVEQLDWLVISHGDQDHVGGLDDLPKTLLDSTRYLLGEPQRSPEISGETCKRGQSGRLGRARIQVLWPGPAGEESWSGNDRSCVVRLAYGGVRILIPGDLERKALQALVDRDLGELRADILILPHHGSRSSFLPEFLLRVNPRLVIVTRGRHTRFGHPHDEVIRWLQRRSIEVLDTAEDGAISLHWQSAHNIRLQTQRPD